MPSKIEDESLILDIDRDDDPHLRGLDGKPIDSYERYGEACYLANVDGERILVAKHEIKGWCLRCETPISITNKNAEFHICHTCLTSSQVGVREVEFDD